MINTVLLKEKVDSAGLPITTVSKRMGISREAFYKKVNGDTEFKASEILALTAILHLTYAERDMIFFTQVGEYSSSNTP